MTPLTHLRTLTAAALVALSLAGGFAPAAAAAPDPSDAAAKFQGRCPEFSGSDDALDALAELMRRTQSSNGFLPVQVAAAVGELRSFMSLAGRPGVEGVEPIPSTNAGRSPDALIRHRDANGSLRDMRVEVKTVTGRQRGYRPRAAGGTRVPARPASPRDIRRALRAGSRSVPGRPSQLDAPLQVGGRQIPPGGKLVIQLPRGTTTPTAVADAMRGMAGQLRGAPHVHDIEFHRYGPDGTRTVERHLRDPGGSYRRVGLDGTPRNDDDPPEDDGSDCRERDPRPVGPDPRPIDATRAAIGAAAEQTPAEQSPIPGARTAPVLAPPGRGIGSTGSAAGSATASQLGGIDFSSIELRYVSDVSTDRTRATGFAFKASPARGGGRDGDARTLQRASEAFFVWLALPPDSFTVNLNPDEPDRIVDEQFGRTNAGRVLLEADLRMKKTVARLIHPDTALGRRYWSQMAVINGDKPGCLAFRQWIVPAPATVHESDGELYIVKAPLSVKLEGDYLRGTGAGDVTAGCTEVSPGSQLLAEGVFRRLILPRVQRAVRRAPEYAALRRVYFSRVAAEWYRERGVREDGAFADIIDSGDISRWAQKRSWSPREVFDRYVRSYTDGEFNVKRRTREGNWIVERTYVFGGVDFSKVPRRNVASNELASLRPGLPERISRALSGPAVDPGSGDIWLAGASFDRAAAATDPAFHPGRAGSGVPGGVLVGVLLALLAAGVRLAVRRLGS